MDFEEFCEMIGLKARAKGWIIEGDNYDYPDLTPIDVLGPYTNLYGDTLFTVVLPKGFYEEG